MMCPKCGGTQGWSGPRWEYHNHKGYATSPPIPLGRLRRALDHDVPVLENEFLACVRALERVPIAPA